VNKLIYDFIVIGAGMAGASIAFELASRARVCVLEGEDRPGFHATARSAALFAPTYGGREIRALTRASRSFFDNPPVGFTDHALLRDRGCLYIARSDQLDHLDHMVTTIRDSGGKVVMLDKHAAAKRVSLLREGYVAGAAFDADAMDIEVDSLHQGFLRGGRAAGVVLITRSWVAEPRWQKGIWSIELSDGQTVSAPVLVNAAGAWADTVAERCGVAQLGLQPLRRTALLVDVPAGVDVTDWPAVIDADEMFYFKPEAGKLLLSPADETPDVPRDAYPDDLDVAIAVDRVQSALELEVTRVSHSWAGLRTFAPDRAPVVGFDARVKGFFWCAGQGGYGIQTAPAMGRTAAAVALGERVPADVSREGLTEADLSPLRFS
jgi:D-arginine dehydrogenase